MTKPVIDGEGHYVRRDGALVNIASTGDDDWPFKEVGGLKFYYQINGQILDGGDDQDIIRKATPAEIKARKALTVEEG